MKVLLLVVCVAFLSPAGYAALTADPNIVNGGFEIPVIPSGTLNDTDVVDWLEAEGFNQWSGCYTRLWGTGNWNQGQPVDGGLNFGQLVADYDCIYQAIALFQPNTPYQVTCFIAKRGDKIGPAGSVELWAGGTPPTADDGVNYYGSEGFPLTAAGATLVDSVSFDYSSLASWQWLTGTKVFNLATGSSHTTSDPLYLVFVRRPGGQQLGIDNVAMSISGETLLVNPENGATGLPVTTDADAADDTNTTLAWVGPGTYTGATFDVYIGTTEPNELLADYGLTQVAAGISETSVDPGPLADLEYGTTYYWVVDTYRPDKHSGFANYSTFTTIDQDLPPVVTFSQDGGRTWIGAAAVTLDATVVDEEAIVSTEWVITEYPADYTGDPSLFLTVNTVDNTAPTADFAVNVTDPEAFGFYVIELTATDAADAGAVPPNEALTGSDTVWFTVHATPCLAMIANGGTYNPYDANDDCVIDLTDFAAWAAAWLDDRNPADPIIYLP